MKDKFYYSPFCGMMPSYMFWSEVAIALSFALGIPALIYFYG
jgi:hypothetical protein